MKRTFTQKVKQVPSCAANSAHSFEALLKLSEEKPSVGATIPTEGNRRARTSAAMIGLAISMGASSLLLPQQSDEALAVEPIASEPTLTTLPVGVSSPASVPTESQPDVATLSKPPQAKPAPAPAPSPALSTPVVKHKVQEGQTLWEVSQTYQVAPEAIAASNPVQPNANLSVGQQLKIPTVNGIVHEAKPGETVESVSKSYGVEPNRLRNSSRVSTAGQLKTGESVIVPGQVDDLLKARQNVALDDLKHKRNRLNSSLAELRSEESINQSTTAATPSASATPFPTAERRPDTPASTATNSSTPIGIPVPTPEIAASPTVDSKSVYQPQSPVVIPVPTPEIAASPTVESLGVNPYQSPVVIPVPTPDREAASSSQSRATSLSESSVVIPVPTPDTAASLAVEENTPKPSPSSVVIPVPTPSPAHLTSQEPSEDQKPITFPNTRLEPVTTPEITAQPPTPQPVVMETVVANRAATTSTYEVKPGDTIDAIARRYGLSRSELIQANGLNNPNLIRVNQQLAIPTTASAELSEQRVTFLPGIKEQSNNFVTPSAPAEVEAPRVVVPTTTTSASPIIPTAPTFPPPTASSTVLAQSSVGENAPANTPIALDAKRNQSANTGENPYVERLRADILRMRAEYRHQQATEPTSSPSNVVVPAVPVAPSLVEQSTPARVNPEFNPQRYEQETQTASVPIAVPPPAATPSEPKEQILAAAPAPAESYNPMLQTPVGTTVAPQLPPLSAPDMYLPDSPAPFNGYIWPSKGVLTSGYGRRWGRMHRGIDIAAPIGTPIVAAAPGVVVTAGWNSGGYGKLVEIKHPDGSLTLYAHNNRILVRRGQEVDQGQQISEMGSTGYSTGPHLHFEVHPSGRGAVNPMAYLPKNR
ncbi:MAG: peptidoglycan DD-metalloendopeptidase family protein [Coleofasciculus sp. G1-WW12-02]|uniref:peptidoglycan DD-metalloendopeptidase family protein n=1 Tax=Coleofasciculus sp. G1-WW12-02 TaxID=3068483 RepID=UPI0032F385E7